MKTKRTHNKIKQNALKMDGAEKREKEGKKERPKEFNTVRHNKNNNNNKATQNFYRLNIQSKHDCNYHINVGHRVKYSKMLR